VLRPPTCPTPPTRGHLDASPRAVSASKPNPDSGELDQLSIYFAHCVNLYWSFQNIWQLLIWRICLPELGTFQSLAGASQTGRPGRCCGFTAVTSSIAGSKLTPELENSSHIVAPDLAMKLARESGHRGVRARRLSRHSVQLNLREGAKSRVRNARSENSVSPELATAADPGRMSSRVAKSDVTDCKEKSKKKSVFGSEKRKGPSRKRRTFGALGPRGRYDYNGHSLYRAYAFRPTVRAASNRNGELLIFSLPSFEGQTFVLPPLTKQPDSYPRAGPLCSYRAFHRVNFTSSESLSLSEVAPYRSRQFLPHVHVT
jgi:hypothetical protein